MNHASWIESHNRATNAVNARSRGKRRERTPLPEKLTDFQARVIDILGIVGRGIYNAPIAYDTINYQWGFRGMSVTWRGGFCTFDRGDLPLLVFLCHEARIRLEVDPAGPHLLRLSFFPRRVGGALHERHPNLDEAVKEFRKYFPAEHRINYQSTPISDIIAELAGIEAELQRKGWPTYETDPATCMERAREFLVARDALLARYGVTWDEFRGAV